MTQNPSHYLRWHLTMAVPAKALRRRGGCRVSHERDPSGRRGERPWLMQQRSNCRSVRAPMGRFLHAAFSVNLFVYDANMWWQVGQTDTQLNKWYFWTNSKLAKIHLPKNWLNILVNWTKTQLNNVVIEHILTDQFSVEQFPIEQCMHKINTTIAACNCLCLAWF